MEADEAERILGRHYFGPSHWKQIYDVSFSDDQLEEIAIFPWNRDILDSPCPFWPGELVKDTHFSFLGLPHIGSEPLTIPRWRDLRRARAPPHLAHSTEGYDDTLAARVNCRCGWYLMPIASPQSFRKRGYAAAVASLPPEYDVASVIDQVTKLLLYHDATRKFADNGTDSRCREVSAARLNYHIVASMRSSVDELAVSYVWDGARRVTLGLAASRNPNDKRKS